MLLDTTLEKLTQARIGLLLRTPFFGNMATRMELVDASDWCGTAATDGRRFFYNKDFVATLSARNLEFLFGHEILHCVFDHFGRLGSRHPRLANIAQDFAVNQILVDDKIGDRITQVDICYNSKYRGMAWEEIYELLASKLGSDQPGSTALSKLGNVLDDHIRVSSEEGGKDDKGLPSISKEDAQAIRDEIKQAMIQSAAAAGGRAVPESVARLIKNWTEPKMDWRQLVRQEIQSILRNDYSFTRPSRKGMHTGAILPGMKNATTIEVAIALDMSGSIGSDDAKTFLSEVAGIMDQYEDFTITLWCFDTGIYNPQTITEDNCIDLLEYEPRGGGGTDFDANFEWMKENGIKPKKFIMFTDGYPNGSWGDPDYTDTIFVVKGNISAEAPFGTTVIYENEGG